MSLHEPSLQRLKESALVEGAKLAEMFETLVSDAILNEQSILDMILHWVEPEDEFVAGTYVPEIHFIVRKVEADNETA